MKNTIQYINPYDDSIERIAALQILKDHNPKLNSERSVIDITCDSFYVDIKRIHRLADKYEYAGINKESYDKYITYDMPVYILFMFDDAYALINIDNNYRKWQGLLNDNAKGIINRTMYNYNIKDATEINYYF
jgi:hypothetical protein